MAKQSKQKPGQEYFSYEVIAQEDQENVLIPIPPNLLKELGWKEGEQIQVAIDDMGRFVFKRA